MSDQRLNEKGEEVLDPTPMALPVNFKRPPTIQEMIANYVRSAQWQQERMAAGEETFEEADDFDVGDDYDPSSPYEENFDHVRNVGALQQAIKESKKPRKAPKQAEEEVPLKKKAKPADPNDAAEAGD